MRTGRGDPLGAGALPAEWSFDGEVIVFDAPAGPVEVPGEIYSVQSEGEGTQLFAWHRPSGVIRASRSYGCA
ncbi:MAG: hypothetical protein ACREQY_11250 [Candidatus Binatia bacterium]